MAMIFVAAASGLLFGLGLIVAGMVNPSKVLAFLDVAGAWDPSLALVMAGAISVAVIPYRLMRARKYSLLGAPMQIPTARHIDARLLGGSLLFGVGWGLAGVCPGPSLVLLGTGNMKSVAFVLAMLLGIFLADNFFKKTAR